MRDNRFGKRWTKRGYIDLLLAVFIWAAVLFPEADALGAEVPVVAHLTAIEKKDGLSNPIRFTVDGQGNIYTSAPGAQAVQKFNALGKLLSSIKVPRPLGIKVDRQGNLYVGDVATLSVMVFSQSVFDASVCKPGDCNLSDHLLRRLGSGIGEFKKPSDIAIDSGSGRIYVLDSGINLIRVYNADGTRAFNIGGGSPSAEADFLVPSGIHIDVERSELLVSDSDHYKVKVFDLSGNFLREFGLDVNFESVFGTICGLTVDESGRIYVADSFRKMVQVFDSDGNALTNIGEDILEVPLGVAFDQSNRLLVSSYSKGRVEIYGIDGSDIYDLNPSISINNGDAYTNSTSAILSITCTDCVEMRLSNQGATWDTDWESFNVSRDWTLTSGDGVKVVSVQFKNSAGDITVTYTASVTLDTFVPTGSVVIENDNASTNSTNVNLTLSVYDNGNTALQMHFSNNETAWSDWEVFSTVKSWTLPGGDGSKMVYVRFKDDAGNISISYSDSIILQSSYPTTAATPPGGTYDSLRSVALTADEAATIYYTTDGSPPTTSSNIYNAHIIVNNSLTLTFFAVDAEGNAESPANSESYIIGSGSLPKQGFSSATLVRSDGGSANSNRDSSTNNPRVDVLFTFEVIIRDLADFTPQYTRLYMAQRPSPGVNDFYSYDLTCTGSWWDGARCVYETRLGPASTHKYYFEAKLANDTIIRYPGSGVIDGPVIELLNGNNMIGVPRDIVASVEMTGLTAFGSGKSYCWVSEGLVDGSYRGKYASVDGTHYAVRPGEGYLAWREDEVSALPSLSAYGEVQNSSFTIMLNPGWNLISTPYGGNVKLSDIQVQRGNGVLKTWSQVVAYGWLINAIYFYKGDDWGGTYAFESAGGNPDATLTPWLGYWVYLNKGDGAYYLSILKPSPG